MAEIESLYERAIKALNDADECEAGGDAVKVVEAALEKARAEAFDEAIQLIRKALSGPKDWGGIPLALAKMEQRKWRDPSRCERL